MSLSRIFQNQKANGIMSICSSLLAHLDKNFVWKNLEVVESCDHAKPMNMVEKHRKKTTVKE